VASEEVSTRNFLVSKEVSALCGATGLGADGRGADGGGAVLCDQQAGGGGTSSGGGQWVAGEWMGSGY
jgi:hypothetical protein